MQFKIDNTSDIYKFTLPLADYLNNHGEADSAKDLGELVDACFPNSEQALKAHKDAFSRIKSEVQDLPKEYSAALDDALDILDKI